jgi:hypothetical protein
VTEPLTGSNSLDSPLSFGYGVPPMKLRVAGIQIQITVDNCGPVTMPCAAPGGVIDPQGNWVCRTEPQGECFFVHTVEL